jgi:hypothetical protein
MTELIVGAHASCRASAWKSFQRLRRWPRVGGEVRSGDATPQGWRIFTAA